MSAITRTDGLAATRAVSTALSAFWLVATSVGVAGYGSGPLATIGYGHTGNVDLAEGARAISGACGGELLEADDATPAEALRLLQTFDMVDISAHGT